MIDYTVTTTQKAALVRRDISAALKSGELAIDAGELPAGLRISVRTGYASLMSEIRVTIKGAPDEWALIGAATGSGDNARCPTRECRALGDALMAIIGRYYDANGKTCFATVSLDGGLTLASA